MIRQIIYKGKDYIIVNTDILVDHEGIIERSKVVIQVDVTSIHPKYRSTIFGKVDSMFNKRFRYIIQKPKPLVKTKPWYKFW
jgi:hypothetical protein